MTELGDPILTAIEFALKDTLERYKNPKEEDGKIIREGLKRGEILIHHLRVMGVSWLGMSREQFIEELKQKNMVVMMTKEEYEEYRKAMDLYGYAKNKIGNMNR